MAALIKLNILLLFLNIFPTDCNKSDCDKCVKNRAMLIYYNCSKEDAITLSDEYFKLNTLCSFDNNVINAEIQKKYQEEIKGDLKKLIFRCFNLGRKLTYDEVDYNLFYIGNFNSNSKIFMTERILQNNNDCIKDIYMINSRENKVTSIVRLSLYINSDSFSLSNFLSKTQMLNNEMFVLRERVPSDVAIAKDAIVFPKMRRTHLYGYCVKFKITKKGRVRII